MCTTIREAIIERNKRKKDENTTEVKTESDM
jgi:hypothetical protein